MLVRRLQVALTLGALACGRFGADRRAEDGTTALMRAAQQGDSAEVARLIDQGADVDAEVSRRDAPEMVDSINWMQALPKSDMGFRALHYAIRGGHRNVVQLLLKHGADVSPESRGGATPLQLALLRGDVETQRMLLYARARIEPRDLWLATSLSPAAAVALLIQQGANVFEDAPAPPFKSLPPLQPLAIVATTRGDPEVLKVLIDGHVAVNERDRNGWTALRWAKHGQRRGLTSMTRMIALLEAAGAKDASGQRASQLLDAIVARDTAAVRRALALGANPNARDEGGVPALALAAGLGLGDVVRILIAANADVNASDRGGKSVLQYAAPHPAVQGELRAAGAR